MAQVSYTQSIKATPEQVWAIISDVTRLPEWTHTEGRFPHPVEARYGTDQREGVGTVWIGVSTDGQEARQQIIVWEPPRKLVTELERVENAPLAMQQINTYSLTPTDSGTDVTWMVDWQVKGGFSLAWLSAWLTAGGGFEEMIVGSLENLQQLLESSEG